MIQVYPSGAVADQGPDKALFSPDLNAPAVFDLQLSDGIRLRGGIRAIRLTDTALDQSVTVATVKASAPGELVPPNQIVHSRCFIGLAADVVLVWKHNAFSQSVIFQERPILPEGFSPDSIRLEVLTEWIEASEPTRCQATVNPLDQPTLVDDVTIGWGSSVMLSRRWDRRLFSVAQQISNLLYRRLPVGMALDSQRRARMDSQVRRLETCCDTAGWKSARAACCRDP
ncbi:MAG: hypothetical protein M1608_14330 [Candidatus Omnitrophica bacterium]|nr:hypothetical protein [Candidatus Omnitrophota bacterium]